MGEREIDLFSKCFSLEPAAEQKDPLFENRSKGGDMMLKKSGKGVASGKKFSIFSFRAWHGVILLRGVMVTQLILVQLFKVRVLAG